MTQPATANQSLAKRVMHVTIVALCTASSLAVLGAVPAKWAMNRRTIKPVVVTAAVAPRLANVSVEETIVPQFAAPVETRELLVDDVPAAVVVAAPAAPRTRVIRMEVTAYCSCTKCCGPNAQGLTASGKPVSFNDGKFVAADTSVLPFGKQLVIPGYADGKRVEVADRGGAIKGNKLDLFFPTHAEALEWGRQQLDVTVYE